MRMQQRLENKSEVAIHLVAVLDSLGLFVAAGAVVNVAVAVAAAVVIVVHVYVYTAIVISAAAIAVNFTNVIDVSILVAVLVLLLSASGKINLILEGIFYSISDIKKNKDLSPQSIFN